MKLIIKVVPGASKTEIVGWMGERLKIRVAAPPEKGKANRAVERLLSESLGISAHGVRLEAGATSQWKVVEIEGLSREQVIGRLSQGAA